MQAVSVTWIDSSSPVDGYWHRADECDQHASQSLITTLGYLVKETDDFLVIASSIHRGVDEHGNHGGLISIPNVSIVSWEDI